MATENRITRLLNADETYPAFIAAITHARSSLDWANYCFERGRVFERFYKPLAAAARRGVRVRILVDAYGSEDLNRQAIARLESAGIAVTRFQPLEPRRPWHYNHRLHKKLLIVDGSIGFTGGVGVSDYWMNPSDFPQSWRDTHFRLTGPAVTDMAESFAQSWNEFSQEQYRPQPSKQALVGSTGSKAAVIAVNSLPRGRGVTPAGSTLISLIGRARRSITITTAYFGPSRTLRAALKKASARGVRIRILTNGPYCTHEIARDAGRYLYPKLMRAGIDIYEYQPTKIHAKIFTFDDTVSYIGSMNLNFRSFYHDEEFNLAVRDPKLTAQLASDFEHDLKSAQLVTPDSIKHQPLPAKVRQRGISLGRYFF